MSESSWHPWGTIWFSFYPPRRDHLADALRGPILISFGSILLPRFFLISVYHDGVIQTRGERDSLLYFLLYFYISLYRSIFQLQMIFKWFAVSFYIEPLFGKIIQRLKRCQVISVRFDRVSYINGKRCLFIVTVYWYKLVIL